MDVENLFRVLLVLLIVLSGGIGVYSLQKVGRRRQDYLMGGGALLAAICGIILALEVFNTNVGLSEMTFFSFCGLLGMGMLLFSMGFLFDQLQSRRIRKGGERSSVEKILRR